jgi:CRP/FNR family transcriptional regulator, nitrogen oxide reductase regulator
MPASGIAIVSPELRSLFLDGFAPPERRTILSGATQRRYATNSVITNEGHPADHLFLVTSGLARYFIITEKGRKILLQWLGPGDVLGGRAVLSRHTSYLASTETVKDTSLLVWDRPTIRSLVARYPRLLENALLTASDCVAWYLTSHTSLVDHTARQRVAKVLVTLARTVGQKTPAGIALHITNEELANAANVTQFTASRLISGWERKRALEKRRGSILLLSPERLSYE